MALFSSSLLHLASGSCLSPEEDGLVLYSGSSYTTPPESSLGSSSSSVSLRHPPASHSVGSICGYYDNLHSASFPQRYTELLKLERDFYFSFLLKYQHVNYHVNIQLIILSFLSFISHAKHPSFRSYARSNKGLILFII